jgi:hypothetical protein
MIISEGCDLFMSLYYKGDSKPGRNGDPAFQGRLKAREAAKGARYNALIFRVFGSKHRIFLNGKHRKASLVIDQKIYVQGVGEGLI